MEEEEIKMDVILQKNHTLMRGGEEIIIKFKI